MPEPWDVVKHAERALRPGGIFLTYLPTITQVQLVREALSQHSFGLEESVEILRRTWHVDGRSVRPDHRMVAHTGFLTSARRLVGPPERLVALHEDAFAGALFSGFSNGVFEFGGTMATPSVPPGFALHVVALFHVGQTVIEEGKDRGTDLFTEPSPVQRSWSIHTFICPPSMAEYCCHSSSRATRIVTSSLVPSALGWRYGRFPRI